MPGISERIEAWLAVRDAERFQRDMDKSAKSVRKLRDEADGLNASGIKLGQGLGGVRISLASFMALSIGAVPIVLGLSGTVGALTGSLGAATLGAGALATAVGGVLLPSLLGSGIVIGRSIRDFHNVSTALNAYQLAVASYGRNSTQADTALRRLSGTVDKFGGVSMLRAVRNWQELGKSFDVMTAPGRRSVGNILNNAIEGARRLLPSFAGMSNTVLGALERDSKGVINTLSSPEAQRGLRGIGDEFDRISGPLSRSVSNFFLFLLRTTNELMPQVTGLALGIEHFSDRLLAASARDDFGHTLHGLYAQTLSWWHLLMEVGGLIVAVLRPGADEGQSLVNTLALGAHHLRMMAESVSGQQSLDRFFHDSIDNSVAFARALWVILGPLLIMAREAMPMWTDVLNANAAGLHVVLGFVLWLSHLLSTFGGLLGIVIGGFWAWKTATLALAAAETVLTFATTGWVGAFWALNAAMVANPIGAVVVGVLALAAAVYLAYQKSSDFRNIVHDVWDFVSGHWPLLAGLILGPWGFAILMIITHLGTIKDAASDVLDFIVARINNVIDVLNLAIKGFNHLPFHKDIGLIRHIGIPGLATGGDVTSFGSWVSGESGAELNTWSATGVHVAPIRPARIAGRGTVRTIDAASVADSGSKTIVVPVHLNGREIARAVAEDTDDRLARSPG